MVDDTEDRVLIQLDLVARTRGYQYSVLSPSEAQVETSKGPQVFSLSNLRMLVAQEPAAKRLGFVFTFLDEMVKTGEAAEGVPDFEQTREKLRVRLYPEEMESTGIEPLRRRVAPGLVENVVFDEPHKVVTPARDLMESWPLTPDEIFAAARANVRARTKVEFQSLEADEAPVFAGYLADYASAHALWLDQFPVLGRHGALVTIPVEGALYAHPLDGPSLIEAQNLLVHLALRRQEGSPRAISADVYHWQDGSLDRALRVTPEPDGTIEVFVEANYQGLMESLL